MNPTMKVLINFTITSRLEIYDYAIYLGIDPTKDKDLLFIAKEGLNEPLPAPWKACRASNGGIYFFNL